MHAIKVVAVALLGYNLADNNMAVMGLLTLLSFCASITGESITR